MAAVIVTTARPLPARRPAPVERPALQVIEGGRKAARPRARALTHPRPLPPAVYRRRRLGAALALATVVLVSYLAIVGVGALLARPAAGAPATPAAASGASAVHDYVVQPGDTLWSIARSLHPHGDVRPVVDQLEARAGGATLVPGQRLRLDGIGG
jgi:hypothetical protein